MWALTIFSSLHWLFLAATACQHTRSSAHWPATWTNQILFTSSWTWPIIMPCGTPARYPTLCSSITCAPFLLSGFVSPLLTPDLSDHSYFQGAAFGFHMIAAKAGEQLAPFLPQLVPRLYRYQFDPNLSIRQAMTSIWDALVTDKTLVGAQIFPQIHAHHVYTNSSEGISWCCLSGVFQVDKYLREILQDVISNLTNSTWRVRESR